MKLTRILPLLLVCGCSADVSPTPAPSGSTPAKTERVAVTRPSSLPALRRAPALDAWEWTNASGAPNISGKPAIVEFWATWCGPCIRATPHVVDLARKYEKQGLVVAGIHVQKGIDDEKVAGFIDAFTVPYAIGLDRQDTVRHAYGVGPIPRAFIIAHTGDIVWEGNPLSNPTKFDQVVAQVVKDATAQ